MSLSFDQLCFPPDLSSESSDIFTVSFFPGENGQPHATQLTHENLTAGIAATESLLPATNGVTSLDTIISSHTLSSAYGRCIAYTAIYKGSSFATLENTRIFDRVHGEPDVQKPILEDLKGLARYPIPSPTILFTKPDLLEAVTSAIEGEAKRSGLLYRLASSHKRSGIVGFDFVVDSFLSLIATS